MSDADWRLASRYLALDDLSPAELAWEFLRRNPDYQRDYNAWRERGATPDDEIDLDRWKAWGLTFPADPQKSALAQNIFWSPDAFPHVVVLTPAPEGAPASVTFEPQQWPGRVVARRAADGLHALLKGRDGCHRLWMPEPIAVGQPVSAVLPLGGEAAAAAAAALQFWRHLSGVLPSAPPRQDMRQARLRMTLQAVDGRQAGASYRSLAEWMFGADRVALESWRTSSLRDATIRLVRNGSALTAGGYRRLLGQKSEG